MIKQAFVSVTVQIFVEKQPDGVRLVLEIDQPKAHSVSHLNLDDLKETYREMVMQVAEQMQVGDRIDILPMLGLDLEKHFSPPR